MIEHVEKLLPSGLEKINGRSIWKKLRARYGEKFKQIKKEAINNCRRTRKFTERTHHQSTLFGSTVNNIYIIRTNIN